MQTQSHTLEYFLKREHNNFDLMRILLALYIIIHHAAPIAQIDLPILTKNALNLNFGNTAVAFFFFLSGLVVTNSLVMRPSFIYYFSSRIARIFPGLICVLVVTALVIGPLVTNLPLTEYFSLSEVYDYIRVNLSLGARHYLPGVFENNTTTTAVNGSLWTINWEIRSYLYLFVLLYVLALKKYSLQIMILSIFILLIISGIMDQVLFSKKIYAKPYFILFFIAALLVVLKDKIPINRYTWLATTLFMIFAFALQLSEGIRFLSTSLFFMHLSFWPPFVRLKLKEDISYGVYIWAFPLAQTTEYFLPNISYILHVIIVMALSIMMGTFSWRYIEKPGIRVGKNAAQKLNQGLKWLQNKRKKSSSSHSL